MKKNRGGHRTRANGVDARIHMRRLQTLLAASIPLSIAAACDSVQDLYVTNATVLQTPKDEKSLNEEFGPIILDNYTLARGHLPRAKLQRRFEVPSDGRKTPNGETSTVPLYLLAKKYEERAATADPNNGRNTACQRKAKYYRNSLVDAIKRRSEKICTKHQADILANSASFNFVAGFVSTGLSAVSAAVGGEAIKTGLSTASSIVNAAGTGVKAEFYQNLLAAAIVRKIGDVRAATLTEINRKLEESDVDKYRVDQAIRDVEEYHKQCSFYVGLVQLTEDADRPEMLTYEQAKTRIGDIDEALAEQKRIIDKTERVTLEEKAGAQRQYMLLQLERERLQGLLTQPRVKIIGGAAIDGSGARKK